jgi:predicted secreted hydrolase
MTADRPTRRAALATLAALAAGPAAAQGFAGMGSDAAGFAPVVPGGALRFPEDHGPHPGFRIEWWYVTANLRGADGAAYGCQWTLFRYALAPGGPEAGWSAPRIWMAHAAATSATAHRAAEKFARGGVGQAGARIDGPMGFESWIDDWSLSADAPPAPGADAMDRLRMRAAGDGFAFDLALVADGPLVLHGEGGYSRKTERAHASWYYSQPHYRAEGRLTLDAAAIPVTGAAWLDREWSSQPLDADMTGWDWFSLRFASGDKLMLYRLRRADGGAFAPAGTWIGPDGRAERLDPDAISMRPTGWERVAGARTPVRWRLEVADRGLSVDTAPLNPQAWNALTVPYWEGPVTAEGTHPGEGYLEMTGYAAD